MARGVHWICNGRLGPVPEGMDSPAQERQLLQRQGFVKVVESETGTTLRWSMFASNWSSLFFVAEWVHGAIGPFYLQYYSCLLYTSPSPRDRG